MYVVGVVGDEYGVVVKFFYVGGEIGVVGEVLYVRFGVIGGNGVGDGVVVGGVEE